MYVSDLVLCFVLDVLIQEGPDTEEIKLSDGPRSDARRSDARRSDGKDMKTGVVTEALAKFAYGFIEMDETKQKVFFDQISPKLRKGDRVKFELGKIPTGKKHPPAGDIQKIS